eukprot:16004308-Heterocapsa_arctica.AAC.1
MAMSMATTSGVTALSGHKAVATMQAMKCAVHNACVSHFWLPTSCYIITNTSIHKQASQYLN